MNNLKFEEITCKNVKEYEKVVRERLDLLQKDSPDMFVTEFYWDYRDEVGLEHFQENKDISDIIGDIEFELLEYNMDYYAELEESVIVDLLKEIKVDLSEDLEENLDYFDCGDYDVFKRELAIDYVTVDLKVEDLLENTIMDLNIFPYQEENLNSEGDEVSQALDILCDLYLNWHEDSYWILPDDRKEKEKMLNSCESLKRLFNSQGYKFQDLADNKKVENSKFLKSFIEEMANNTQYFCDFLCFTIEINAKEYLEKIHDKKNRKLIFDPKDDYAMGIFNPVQGSGSLLEMELEKPFIVETNRMEYQIEGSKYHYGRYTVCDVYGDHFYSKDFKFEEIEECVTM